MIKDDYVSFETAKLLKKKGFDGNCFYVWVSADNQTPSLLATANFVEGAMATNKEILDVVTQYHNTYESNNKIESFLCPTLQMVMRWLRKVHHLSVEVYRTACGYIGCVVAIPSGTDIKFLEEDGDDLPSGTYTKWEYACEAAIKYCLNNLI